MTTRKNKSKSTKEIIINLKISFLDAEIFTDQKRNFKITRNCG